MAEVEKTTINVPMGPMVNLLKPNWRDKYRTSTEQLYYMYCKGIATDCVLNVEKNGMKEEFHVHRLQLARASSRFHFMIAKVMNTRETLRINIEEKFSPQTIRLMLRCIYEDKVELSTFQEAFNCAFAAHMYDVKILLDISASALIKYLTPGTIYDAWILAQTLSLPDVTNSCIEALQLDTLQCISSARFVEKVSEDFLVLLLEQDRLSVKDELLLVNVAISWARHEAKKRGLSGDDAGVRKVIAPRILGHLRLLTVSLEMFLTGPGLSGWLTNEEKQQIMVHIRCKDKDELPHPLCNLRTRREKGNPTEVDQGKHRSNVCKLPIITKQPNLQLTSTSACNFCSGILTNETPGACFHALGIFRVKSSCRLVGFDCLSRVFKIDDPTFIYRRNHTYYKECIGVVLISYGHSLKIVDTQDGQRYKILYNMQYNADSHYNSTVKVKFSRPVELKTKSWYGLGIVFRSTDPNEQVEYPYRTRPAQVTSTSGVEFKFLTKEIPGFRNSYYHGVFKKLILA